MRIRLAGGIPLLALALGCGGGGGSTPPTDSAQQADGSAPPIDAKVYMDAPTGDFGCLGAALPTTADDPVTIDGTTESLSGLSTVKEPGVLVEAYATGNGTALTSDTSASDGTFSLTVTTGGTPLDGYLKATKSGLLDFYVFPATPIAASISNVPVLLLSSSSLGTVETIASVTPANDPSSVGLVGVVVEDCAGNPVAGATVSLTESSAAVGDMRYMAGSVPSTTATTTDSSGAAFVFNVPTGTATVTAQVAGMTLRTHDITVTGNAVHATIVVP
jgi:hypothetical protein